MFGCFNIWFCSRVRNDLNPSTKQYKQHLTHVTPTVPVTEWSPPTLREDQHTLCLFPL